MQVIHIEDVNDNAPQFETTNVVMTIAENSPVGSTVGQLTAHDSDLDENALVQYQLVGGPDMDSFLLTTETQSSSSSNVTSSVADGGGGLVTAVLTTLIELDFEAEKHEYVVHVQARSDHLFSVAIVRIVVVDVNDNAPILGDFLVIFNNYKDQVTTVHSTFLPMCRMLIRMYITRVMWLN